MRKASLPSHRGLPAWPLGAQEMIEWFTELAASTQRVQRGRSERRPKFFQTRRRALEIQTHSSQMHRSGYLSPYTIRGIGSRHRNRPRVYLTMRSS